MWLFSFVYLAMFEQLKRLAENTINLDVNEISVSVFQVPEIKQFIIRLNRVEQLYNDGLDVNDNVIGVYSEATGKYTSGETFIFNGLVSTKRAGEHFTLFNEGVFYESFRVIVDKSGFTIMANTIKEDEYSGETSDLMQYGEILGLTTNSKDELGQKMLPFLQKAIRESILKEVL